MKSRTILTALATASLIVGGQAIAQGRGGGQGGGQGGGHGAGHGAGMGAGLGRGNDGGALGGNHGREVREEARINSQGPLNASDRARERANENSVLSDGTSTAPDLSGLTEGQTVVDSDGNTLGTIRRVSRSNDGTVRNVLVTNTDGRRRVIRVAPGTLTLNGDIVVTTDED